MARWMLPLILVSFNVLRGEEIEPPNEAEQAAIAKVKMVGGQVLEVAQNDKHLDVAYHLSSEKITDDAIAPVKELSRLIVLLNLRGTEVGDAGTAHLKELKELKRLHLEKTKVTDAGIENLAGLEKLEYLNLYSTEITDAGLKHLHGLKSLKSLYLWQTKVTDEGVKGLQEALPELKIIRGEKTAT